MSAIAMDNSCSKLTVYNMALHLFVVYRKT